MEWMGFIIVFLTICVVWFFMTRIWAGGIDLLISGFKKLFKIGGSKNERNWNTLEEIREKSRKDEEEE